MGNTQDKPQSQHGNDDGKPLNVEYNVFSQPINPQNNMPLAPNQIPAEGQEKPLSTERVVSSIPKGGTDGRTWAYPSEQMFYNALRRKNKADNMTEDDVGMIVAIHNNMNEKTWNRIREWEAMHQTECPDGPRLSRFLGRPDDLTPLAYIKSFLPGSELPFDRHDWFVDRCGREVRYVIDYYHSDEKSALDKKPAHQQDRDAIKSIEFNARPALDSFQAAVDRVRLPVLEMAGMEPDVPDIVLPEPKAKPTEPVPAEPVPDFTKLSVDEMRTHSQNIHKKCQGVHKALRECGEDETQCRKLSVSMFHCLASVVCPGRADAYAQDVSSEKKFDDILECLGKFEDHAGKVFAKPSSQ